MFVKFAFAISIVDYYGRTWDGLKDNRLPNNVKYCLIHSFKALFLYIMWFLCNLSNIVLVII